MKLPNTLKIAAALWLVSGPSVAGEKILTTVKSIAETRPCVTREATLPAYLQASRHGSWLTDGPGINTPGIAVSFRVTDPKQREELLSYVFRPQIYLHNTFYAVFVGVVTCDGGKPMLEIQGLNGVQIRPVRDAGVSPNNSFKPKPLRGSA